MLSVISFFFEIHTLLFLCISFTSFHHLTIFSLKQVLLGDPISIDVTKIFHFSRDKTETILFNRQFHNRIETNKIMVGHIRTAIKQNAPTIRSISYPILLNRPRSLVFVVVVDSFHVRGTRAGEKRKIFKLRIN